MLRSRRLPPRSLRRRVPALSGRPVRGRVTSITAPGIDRHASIIVHSPWLSAMRGLMANRSPRPPFHTNTRLATPICGAARPTASQRSSVLDMVAHSAATWASTSRTAAAALARIGSPMTRMLSRCCRRAIVLHRIGCGTAVCGRCRGDSVVLLGQSVAGAAQRVGVLPCGTPSALVMSRCATASRRRRWGGRLLRPTCAPTFQWRCRRSDDAPCRAGGRGSSVDVPR